MRPFVFMILTLVTGASSAGGAAPRKAGPTPPNPQVIIQVGHPGAAEELTFSPNERLLATCGADATLRVWDVSKRILIWTRDSVDGRTAFSPDSRRLAVLDAEARSVLICNSTSGKVLTHWKLSQRAVGLAWSPNGKFLACGSTEQSVDLCDPTSGEVIRSFRTHGDTWVGCLVFSPNSGRLLCAGGKHFSTSRTADVVDVQTGDTLAALRLGGRGACADFSADGSQLAIGCNPWPSPGTIEVWDTQNWTRSFVLAHHRFPLTSVSFGDGPILFGIDEAGTRSQWDVPSGTLIRSAGTPGRWGESAMTHTLAAVNKDDGVQLVDCARDESLGLLPGRLPDLRTLAVSPDGETVVAVSGRRLGFAAYQEAALWDLRTGQWKGAIPWPDGDAQMAAVSPNGRTAAVLEFSGTVALLDLQARVFLRRARARNPDENLTGVGFLGNDRFWVAGTRRKRAGGPGSGESASEPDERVLEVFEFATGRRQLDLHPDAEVLSATGSAQGDRLTVFTADGKLRTYDPSGQSAGARELIPQPGRKTARFSPRGTFLAINNDEGLRLWSVREARWVGTLADINGYSALEAVSEQRLVLLRDENEGNLLLDGRTGKRCGHVGALTSLDAGAFLPDGNTLVYASGSGVVTVANSRTGAIRAIVTLLPRWRPSQEWLAITPSGHYIGSSGAEASLLWRVGSAISPGDRFRSTRRDPERVQLALTGHDSAEVFSQIADATPRWGEIRMRQWSAILPSVKPLPEPRTPNERLTRALSDGDYYTQSWDVRLPAMLKEVRLQISAGADPNTMGSWGTPLMLAVTACDAQFVRELLRLGARVDEGDASHRNALQRAAMEDSAELAHILLDAGAQLRDLDGKSLLGLSKPELNQALRDAADVYYNKYRADGDPFRGPNTAWLLLHLGADPNTRSADGSSLLNHAFHPWLIRMLLRKGADPNFHTAKNEAPLITCVTLGQVQQVQLLLEGKADPNVSGSSGDTGLISAAREGKFEILQLLLDHHANPNLVGRDGNTALLAASGEHLESLRLLLDHGANPNVQNKAGQSPLMMAITRRDPATVKLLLSHHANARVLTPDGKTLLQLLTETDPVDRFDIRTLLQPSP